MTRLRQPRSASEVSPPFDHWAASRTRLNRSLIKLVDDNIRTKLAGRFKRIGGFLQPLEQGDRRTGVDGIRTARERAHPLSQRVGDVALLGARSGMNQDPWGRTSRRPLCAAPFSGPTTNRMLQRTGEAENVAIVWFAADQPRINR